MPVANQFVIGVDIGGTKVAAGLVSAAGELLLQKRSPMTANGDANQALRSVTGLIDALLAESRAHPHIAGAIDAIGVCSPGPLDPKSGVVINPPNLPCWRNFPLAEEIAHKYQKPVSLDNDGNAAALAEALWGAGRAYRDFFYVTIGTGIGTGIILDHRIFHGRTGAAGEGGHVSIDYRGPRCGCGKLGCIEALASGPAIARRARAKLATDTTGSAILACALDAEHITCEHIAQAYQAGDELARQVLEETADLLAIWLGSIIDLLDPEAIVVGGGVARMLVPFFQRIRSDLPRWCVNSRCQEIPLLSAHYGSDAGIVGAAALCSQSTSD